MYVIKACVSGPAGTRVSVVTDTRDEPMRFETFDAATDKAKELSARARDNMFRTADFMYWPEPE